MSVKKLLIIHPGALGDVVTSFTSLMLLRETYSHIDMVCRQSIGRLAASLKVIKQGFNLETAFFSGLFGQNPLKFNDDLLKFISSYDDMVLFSFSEYLAENIQMVFGKKVFQIPPRPGSSKTIQVSRHLISCLIDAQLLRKESINNFFYLYKDFRDSDFNDRKILIHPGSGSLLKNWPLRHFLNLEKFLSDSGYETVFILGPAEEGMVEIILREGLAHEQVLVVSDPLELVNILKTGGAFIGNDSGVSHVAAFIGLPSLIIFGPTDPLRWCPMGRKVESLKCPSDCVPCFESSKKGCETRDCLAKISPEQVYQKFKLFMELPAPG